MTYSLYQFYYYQSLYASEEGIGVHGGQNVRKCIPKLSIHVLCVEKDKKVLPILVGLFSVPFFRFGRPRCIASDSPLIRSIASYLILVSGRRSDL